MAAQDVIDEYATDEQHAALYELLVEATTETQAGDDVVRNDEREEAA